jgi:hypothetical protein
MYNHSGTTDFLKLASVLVFIGVGVWWLQGAIGQDYTVLVIFALIGVILFAGGALFGHMNQKQTLDAITKFNANDAQIDRYRMASFKAQSQGEAAMQKAAAALTVLDAKRVTQIADQRAKMLVDGQRQAQPAQNDTWAWDTEDADDNVGFQEWR